jgi:hypothetical protein
MKYDSFYLFQTVQTPRGPMPLMQINTLAAQQSFLNIPQNFTQANIQQTFQANLLLAQQQALMRAGTHDSLFK